MTFYHKNKKLCVYFKSGDSEIICGVGFLVRGGYGNMVEDFEAITRRGCRLKNKRKLWKNNPYKCSCTD